MNPSIYGNIIPENDQTISRRDNLEAIRELVGNVYPNRFSRSNVAATPEGEDTITALVNAETLARVVGEEGFAETLTRLESRAKAGGRPTAEELEPINNVLNRVTVRVAGRLATPPRVMGKAAFVHLSDGNERLQIYVRRQEAIAVSNDSGQPVEEEESGWKLFQLLDHGDFAGVEGFLFVTKTGELSVHVHTLQFLSKALLPMPDKMHGIADPEIRQRQRYADLIASSLKVEAGDEHEGEHELSTREVFVRRSKMISEMRRYLDDHGYIEVETPMLSPIASGAAARPFETHHNALDIKLYARIAPELYLKRLVVGGFERVYELNRNFRNEGISTRHNPEFTMLEFYCAYMDADRMMDFCEEMLRWIVQTVTGGTTIRFGEQEIDFRAPFERFSMKESIQSVLSKFDGLTKREVIRRFRFTADFNEILAPNENEFRNFNWLDEPQKIKAVSEYLSIWHYHGDFALESRDESDEELKQKLDELWRKYLKQEWEDIKARMSEQPVSEEEAATYLANIFERISEFQLTQPIFITDFPKAISPLSKASPDNPAVAERFELYIAGMEVANGFSELNDPQEQLARFEEQARQRERGDDEAMQTDTDYVRALAYGMPPAAGIGIGIDRLAMLVTNRRSIRDVILFPHMRPRRPQQDEAQSEDTQTETTET